MPNDIGTQERTVAYFAPVDSFIVNRIAKDIRKTGIYSGGYLSSLVANTSVSLSSLSCEITDGTYQERIRTTTAITGIDITGGKSYVVLRWVYTGSSAADYMEVKGVTVGNLLPNDLIVGVATTGIDYTLRSNPQVMDTFLKVEPSEAGGLYVRIRAGRVNYGSVNYDIVDQLSPLMSAPGSGTNVYAIQINTSGAVVATGPQATTPPDYGGLVTLAEIRIAAGQSSIVAANIKDVRAFGASGTVIPLPIANGGTGSITKNFVGFGTVSGAQITIAVGTGVTPGTWTILDLSSIIGTRSTWVYLAINSSTTATLWFNMYDVNNPSIGPGLGSIAVGAGGAENYTLILTNSDGTVRCAASTYMSSVTFTPLSFLA